MHLRREAAGESGRDTRNAGDASAGSGRWLGFDVPGAVGYFAEQSLPCGDGMRRIVIDAIRPRHLQAV